MEILIKFESEHEAKRWEWLFCGILRMQYCCIGGFMNGFTWR